ncbi:MAG: thioredoxin domain-containing protein [Tessaracoccus sp.]|uniref:DsbA family protein n=1 Tax=Tessaracoccus sp. TaxID=1971211 RepID=UPI001EB3BF73|nr:thioredoxin domain-containing protein [Tessaracoccus sp.]MBK7820857.1 thioredoxin domain-containing protein [Tessaracoccus sp.]
MSNNSSLSKRAALRQQQELEERTKKTKRIVGAGLGLLALVAVVVLGIVIWQALAAPTNKPVATEQLTPPNATANHGILLEGKQPSTDKPHLIVYQDFQCPWCAMYEAAYGEAIEELVKADRITAEYRTVHFLDGQAEDGPSRRAAVAAAAADEVGFYSQYQAVIFANHKEAAAAYPARQLREDFANQAGITGDALTKFQDLFDTRAFNDFTAGAQEQWSKDGLRGTPVYLVSGEQLPGLVDNAGQPVVDNSPDGFYQILAQSWEKGGKQIEK